MTAAGSQGAAQRSVFDRLRVLLFALFAIGAAVALAAAWVFSNTAADKAYDQLLVSAAMQIAETLNVRDGAVAVSPPDAAFETLALARDDRVFYSAWAPDGALLTGYPQLRPAVPRKAADEPQAANIHLLGVSARSLTLRRYVAGDGLHGWATVVVAQTRNARHALALQLTIRTSILVLSLGLLGFLSAQAAARRALRPLELIEQALARRQPHDVRPLDVESPRETLALVLAINATMSRLADRMEKLQTFAAVAAHQIRTPLAAMNAQLELLETDESASARRARAGRIRGRVGELARLTNQLLGHAMLLYRHDLHPRELVDLAALARNAFDNGVPLSLDRDVSLSFHAPKTPVLVPADPLGLKEGLTNLVHNAVVHGAPSQLEMRIELADGEARVIIFDDGPGIPPASWEDVLSPFTSARSQGHGAGLGLSIVDEVVRAHRGGLSFRAPPSGGFEVTVSLPLAEAA